MTKFEVIRDWDGEVRGYRLGDYYLAKFFYWCNDYSWVIVRHSDTGDIIGSDDYNRLRNESKILFPKSCKHGKDILIALDSGARLLP